MIKCRYRPSYRKERLYEKNMLSLLLSFCMITNLTSQASALDHYNTHEASTFSASTYSLHTEFQGVRMAADGSYSLVDENGQNGVSVGRWDIDLLDDSEFNKAINSDLISDQVKFALHEKRTQAVEQGKSSKIATIFSPWLISSDSRSIPLGRTNYTLNGRNYLIERLCTTGESSGYVDVATGTSAKNVADGITSVFITAAGLSSKTQISMFSTGVSLLQAFLQATGLSSNQISGRSGDLVQICIEYDEITQWVWVQDANEWKLGLHTRCGNITMLRTYSHFYSSSTSGYVNDKNDIEKNVLVAASHFSDDWKYSCETALKNMLITLDEYDTLSWDIEQTGKRFVF